MLSLKIVSRADKNDLVMIRVTNSRKTSYISLGFSLSSEELKIAMLPSPPSPLLLTSRKLRLIQEKMEQMKLQVMMDGLGSASAAEIAAMLKKSIFGETPKETESDKKKITGVAAILDKFIHVKRNEGYKASFIYTRKMLEERLGKDGLEKLTFEDISLKWLYSLDEWLEEKGLSKNTRIVHMKNLRTVMNRAIDEELTQNYPFRRFKMRQEETRKRSLSVEDLRKLFTVEVEEYQEFYRDMFKLIFMLCGINTVDLYNLETVTGEGRVEYRRAKTKRLYSIKVEPEAMEIIERWKGTKKLLCPADRWKDSKPFTKYLNIALKRIGEMRRVGLGGKKEIKAYWPELSSYWARHTWATIARRIGVSKDDIALALGHSTGHDVTDIYIDEDMERVDIANRRVLDWVLYGKRQQEPLPK